MNDQTRKLLTLYLGECWHERNSFCDYCTHCGCWLYNSGMESRTFTTPADADALRRKMVEKRDWEEFVDYCLESQKDINPHKYLGRISLYIIWFANWFMENFNSLAGEWRKEKKEV